jgi:hypothetical protein
LAQAYIDSNCGCYQLMTRLLLEFIGGSWDGMNLCDDSLDPVEAGLARDTYSRTSSGGVGQSVVMPAEYSIKSGDCSKYVVTNRTVVGNEVLVRLEACCSEPAAACACMTKRLLLQFDGGYLDGRTFDGHSSELHEALLAAAYYLVTDQGKIGEALKETLATSPLVGQATDPKQLGLRKGWEYYVTQRTEDEDKILVKLAYRVKESAERGRADGRYA